MDIRLSGPQYGELTDALLNAYHDPYTLQRMLRVRLDKNLWAISTAPDLETQIFTVVDRSQAEGWTARLIAAAYSDRPGNDKVRLFATRFGLGAVDESKSSLERLVARSSKFAEVSFFLGRGLEIEAQVCRVEVPVGPGQVLKGTGFLVAPDVVLTNYHVMEPAILGAQGKSTAKGLSAKASQVSLRFDYKRTKTGDEINTGVVYKLASGDWLIDSSPYSTVDALSDPGNQLPSEEELDYAFLRVDGSPGCHVVGRQTPPGADEQGAVTRGWVLLTKEMPDTSQDATVLIMQHPSGATLKLAIGSDAIVGLNLNGTRLKYQTSTLPGSSGSPVFNIDWELLALHNSGDPDFGHVAEYNQGIPVDKIYALLAKRNKLDALNGQC